MDALMQELTTDRRETAFEYIDCNLCGGKNHTPLFESHDYLLYSPLTFRLVQCNACGLIFLNPRPKNMDEYYTGYYNAIFTKGYFEWLSPDRTRRINRMRPQGKMLDIGCGKGEFLSAMSKIGWDVYGNDISPDNCNYVRNTLGLKNIHCGQFESIDLPEKYFDVITLINVLEHLKEPRQTLQKIHRLLKDDGIVVIESPDFNSMQSALSGKAWYGLDLPRHLYQLSPRIVNKLLDVTGFRVIKKDYFVHALYTFLSIKNSLLRLAGIQKPPASDRDPASNAARTRTVIRKVGTIAVDALCLTLSGVCSLVRCQDIFRLYCTKRKP